MGVYRDLKEDLEKQLDRLSRAAGSARGRR